MARRTQGELGHLLREAMRGQGLKSTEARIDRLDPRTEPAILDRYGRLILARTGRSISEDDLLSDDLRAVASRLQTTPRLRPESPRFILRDAERPRRRTILLPGLYGVAQTFGRLARLLPPDRQVVGWNYPIAEQPGDVSETVEEITAPIIDHELERGTGLPIEIFGYCVGGTVAHEVACRLQDAGIEVPRVIVLDAHPGPSTRTVGTRVKTALLIPRVLEEARRAGAVELGIVRTAAGLIRSLPRHKPSRLDAELVVLRSGSRLGLGPLDAGTWSGLARTVCFRTLPDLGHVEIFRRRHEARIVPHFTAA